MNKDIMLQNKRKNAFRILKYIDKSAFVFILLYVPIGAVTPYISLYFLSTATDELIRNNLEYAIFNIIIMTILSLILMFLNCLFISIDEYKMIKIDIDFRTFLRIKVLNDNEMQIESTLNTLRSKERLAISNGGLENLYALLRKQAVCVMSMIIALSIIVRNNISINQKQVAIDSWTFLFLLGLWCLLFLLMKRVSKKYEGLISSIIEKTDILNRQICYYMEYIFVNPSVGRDIRIFNLKNLIMTNYQKWEDGTIGFYDDIYRQEKKKKIITEFLSGVFMIFIYILFLNKVFRNSLTIGNLSMCIGAILLFNRSILEYSSLKAELETIEDYMYPLLDEIRGESNVTKMAEEVEQPIDYTRPLCIEFRHVYFRYNDTDKYILEDINYKFISKEKTAIVGANGAGKTTLVKLICRLIKPTKGEILLNGKNIEKYNLDEYLNYFSIVFQDFKLFAFTVGENISGSKKPDYNYIAQIGDKLGISHIVQEQILNKPLSFYNDQGIELSGGEMQKIAIARAMYKSCAFYIMDEPTSALDPKSEMDIYEKINEITLNKGCIFISHRMSSCKFCDNIVVLDNGRICEHGNHDSLFFMQGKYYELWNAQAKYFERV